MVTLLTAEPCFNSEKGYTAIPKLVWDLSRDAYDLQFWTTVKMVCEDYGDCHLPVDRLAAFCKMSVGKVVNCRKYLIGVGLIAGELKKARIAPDSFSLPTWRLWIPDLSGRNQEWCDSHPTIDSRLERGQTLKQ